MATVPVLKRTDLRLAVVGHVEWMTFAQVDELPVAGRIAHATTSLEQPAGGGAVCAVRMAQLTGSRVIFFTALGRDAIGRACHEALQELGLELHVAWRDRPTRRGFSMVDSDGDRAITVIGERLQPERLDPLPWEQLETCDAVFASAADAAALQACRTARVMTATPRVRLHNLQQAGITLDALIGSGLDPGEQLPDEPGFPTPNIQILTEGAEGGLCIPGGRYDASPPPGPCIDSYGCGDSFAAGVTAGLAAGLPMDACIGIGADAGAACSTWRGPYAPR